MSERVKEREVSLVFTDSLSLVENLHLVCVHLTEVMKNKVAAMGYPTLICLDRAPHVRSSIEIDN